MTPQERIALLDKQLQLLAKKSETAEGDPLQVRRPLSAIWHHTQNCL